MMRIMNLIQSILLVSSSILGLANAGGSPPYQQRPPPPQQPTIWKIVSRSSSFDILEVALEITGLDGALKDPDDSLTLFAPTDLAFKALFRELGIDNINQVDVETLTDILLYHVTEGKYFSNLIKVKGPVETLQGSDAYLSPQKNGALFVNDAYVVNADTYATNGVVHAINKVLLPPTPPPDNTAYDGNGDWNGSSDHDGDGDFEDGDFFNGDGGDFDEGDFFDGDGGDFDGNGEDLEDGGDFFDNGGGGDFDGNGGDVDGNGGEFFDNGDGGDFDGDFLDSNADLFGSSDGGGGGGGNFDEPNVADIICDDDQFNILQDCLEVSGLKGAIYDSVDITIFAPTNRAFQNLFASLRVRKCNQIPTNRLQEILLYHVIGDAVVFASDLVDGQRAMTLEGGDVVISLQYGKAFVNDAKILETDIVGYNGIIHSISKVLIPVKDYGYVTTSYDRGH